MFGIFKKKARKAVVEVKKMENRDAVEATVWGAYSIAYADGTCDAKEISVLEKTISALPSYGHLWCMGIRGRWRILLIDFV